MKPYSHVMAFRAIRGAPFGGPLFFNCQKKLREFLLAFIYGLASVIFGEEEQKSKNLDE